MTVFLLLYLLGAGNLYELTLEDAVNMALERNLQVLAAEESHNSAYGNLLQARSGFFPQVSLSSSYTYLSTIQKMETYHLVRLEPDPQNPGSFIPVFEKSEMPFGYKNNYSFGLTVQQVLFSWGRLINNYKLAKHNLRSTDYDIEAKKEMIKESVKEAYYNCLLVRRYLDVLNETRKDLEEHYNSVKKRYEEGLASDFELLRAEVQLRNVEPQIKAAETGLKTAYDALKLQLNLPLDVQIKLKDTLEYRSFNADLDSLISLALSERLDLKSTDEKLEVLKKTVAIARSGNKPSVFAQWAYQYQRPFGFEDKWKGMWTFTVGLQFPFFDGFKTYGQVKSMEAQLRQVRYMRELQGKAIALEIRSLYRDLEAKEEALKSQRDNVKLARRAFEMAEEQYRNGYVSSLDVIDAEVAYSQARLSYISALHDYNVALAKLERALKAGSESPSGTSAGMEMKGAPASAQGGSAAGAAPSHGQHPGGAGF
ncbi:MAG: hypothetical protein DRQ04_06510 [Candidatus Hydrothermota bacterium]|nr:MAG: hypothetical protein DRQ04_06510 [Candidatus Hydrothermae bacterium]